MENVISPIVLKPQEGRPLWHLNALHSFKALSEETGGQFWATEGLADKNMAVPLHYHTLEDEAWYVLEGEIAFTLGDKLLTGGPGTFVYIPRNVPHSFQVTSQTARWLGFGFGGNFDQWFFETGEPAKSLELPPPAPPPSEAAVQALIDSLKSYGTVTLGPPPAPLA